MSFDDSEACFNLRAELRESEQALKPHVEVGYGDFGDFQLVGHGKVTNSKCRQFVGFHGCIRGDLHNLVNLDGVSYGGKAYLKPHFHSCDKPSCPKCYKYGWAVREAKNIEARLLEAHKRFGVVEHIVASVPLRDYGLSFEDMRSNAVKAVFRRGVVGGVVIFHGARLDRFKRWYWSPHFHVLGFILGGYRRCRGCKKGCVDCSGFEGRTRKFFDVDGYIVKVLEERKTIVGTAWYQLNHATYKVGVERFHIASWFGVCSYRKLKVTPEIRKAICPICRHDLEKLRYFGANPEILSYFGSYSSCAKAGFFADLVEDGREVWAVDTRRGYTSSE